MFFPSCSTALVAAVLRFFQEAELVGIKTFAFAASEICADAKTEKPINVALIIFHFRLF